MRMREVSRKFWNREKADEVWIIGQQMSNE